VELIDGLAALIPPPRLHRHRYHRVPGGQGQVLTCLLQKRCSLPC
jgi:hypothetical protein